ncbi:MAG: aminotransferase class I/II-fold pyridoxal phosphate-dependent enzyme, partial [Clostridia bacterium]|nr:aminotransferase class I/II-fold pyridoxal phosphate-dependent enzyme [Clostridia bacterium]
FGTQGHVSAHRDRDLADPLVPLLAELDKHFCIRLQIAAHGRRFLLDAFDSLSVPCFEPKGAFYVFPNISAFAKTSEDFCNDFLEKAHVAVVPGSAFGASGEGFIRISYAYSLEHLKKAVERFEKYIKR